LKIDGDVNKLSCFQGLWFVKEGRRDRGQSQPVGLGEGGKKIVSERDRRRKIDLFFKKKTLIFEKLFFFNVIPLFKLWLKLYFKLLLYQKHVISV
jgi:hypothetical protein